MDNTASINSKPRGRPKTGRARDGVLFMRVPKERKEEIKGIVRALLDGAAAPVVGSEIEELRAFNKKLLQDVGELKQENADLDERLQRCAAASDDQKTHWWKKKHDEIKAEMERRLGSSEWAQ